MSISTIKGKRINYIKEGEGEHAFVLIHGWGGTLESMRSLHNLLKKENASVIFDLPGFGQSDSPDADWGVDEYAELVVDFIKSIGLSKIVLFGHSFGGALSVYISVKYPDIVDKLILCAPSFKRNAVQEDDFKNNFWFKIKDFTKIPLYESLKPKLIYVRKLFYKILYPESDVLKHPHLESNFRKIVTQDLTPMISDIKQDTLILWGKKDTYVPLNHAHLLKEGVKKSKLIVHDTGGHGLPKFESDWVYSEIVRFMKEGL
ncbi:alpha/beta hydrolase [Patescibacteria group bacterium]|nr:alpha/beta hydrolase [Patescibacteria group bacterium]